MIATLQRCASNRKMILALAGILVFIVAASYLMAAPPKKAVPAQNEQPQPTAAAATSTPAAAPKDPSRATRINFELVQNGMTEEEVTTILGAPGGSSTNHGTMNGHPYNHKSMTWRNADRTVTISVKLNDGKVSAKNWKKVTPHQPDAKQP
jgi:hypothetical protein